MNESWSWLAFAVGAIAGVVLIALLVFAVIFYVIYCSEKSNNPIL